MRAALRALRRITRMPHKLGSFMLAAASVRLFAFLYGLVQVFELVERLAGREWFGAAVSAALIAWVAFTWHGLTQIQRLAEPIAEFVAAEFGRHEAFLRMEEARRAAEQEARDE